MDDHYYYLLYGLWTYSSRVVVHLVVSCNEELKFAEAHELNCLGYAAVQDTQAEDSLIRSQRLSMAPRETIIIDVEEMKKRAPIRVFARSPRVHPDVGNHQERLINCEVKILNRESPFRKLVERQRPKFQREIPLEVKK